MTADKLPDDGAQQVRLVEMLRRVPASQTLSVDTPNPLGVDTEHFPIGRMCHDAAAALLSAERELAAAREDEASERRWANHYAKQVGALASALQHLEQAYRNKHSPQHRAMALDQAWGTLAAIDAARAAQEGGKG